MARIPRIDLNPKICAVLALSLACVYLPLAGCSDHSEAEEHDHHSHGHNDSWSFTAWGGVYEVFSEIGALVSGESAEALVHVTVLEDFAPLNSGRLEIVFTDSGGVEEVFSASEPIGAGIYQFGFTPRKTGEFDLTLRMESAAGRETIRGGRVRVGTDDEPGGIVLAPAPRGATSAGEPVSFFKEQQWQAAFETGWVRPGKFARALEGLAEARPTAGGEAWVTAPVEGVVAPRPWPYVGQEVAKGDLLFRLIPSVSAGRSLAELEADVDAALELAGVAESRLRRLEELIEVEATSRRELEEARARVKITQARLASAEQDLAAARSVRQGRGGAEPLGIEAPFDGRVASAVASPGAAAGAADRLARVVRTDAVWMAVALPPNVSAQLADGVSGLVLTGAMARGVGGERRADSLHFGTEATRLVSVAPSVHPETGKLDALIEISGTSVPLGSTWNAQVLLATEDEGIVVPTSALVDDGGETVVFLQLAGETFVRQRVEVEARQGDRALVAGLIPGQRLVTRGGESIRRSNLMSTGAGHGHIH